MRERSLSVLLVGVFVVVLSIVGVSVPVHAEEAGGGGEASLVLPDLGSVSFLGGVAGNRLLVGGIVVCLLGLVFGLAMSTHLKNLPVHKSMREISELIYETCKTYLITLGKFILLLEVLISSMPMLMPAFNGMA